MGLSNEYNVRIVKTNTLELSKKEIVRGENKIETTEVDGIEIEKQLI